MVESSLTDRTKSVGKRAPQAASNERQRQMENYKVKRDGLPPIVFTGEKIGHGTTRTVSGSGQNRWTDVDIYRTQGGKYIASIARMTIWEGESNRRTATSKPTAAEIIQWLKDDTESETLGDASQEAVEDAVKVDEGFQSTWIEVIE